MIRRLLARLFRRSAGFRHEAAALVDVHGPRGAFVFASDKVRLAQVVDAEDEARRWTAVLHEIERQTGYHYQPESP